MECKRRKVAHKENKLLNIALIVLLLLAFFNLVILFYNGESRYYFTTTLNINYEIAVSISVGIITIVAFSFFLLSYLPKFDMKYLGSRNLIYPQEVLFSIYFKFMYWVGFIIGGILILVSIIDENNAKIYYEEYKYYFFIFMILQILTIIILNIMEFKIMGIFRALIFIFLGCLHLIIGYITSILLIIILIVIFALSILRTANSDNRQRRYY